MRYVDKRRTLQNVQFLNERYILTNALPCGWSMTIPTETSIFSTDAIHKPTLCGGSSKPLPYKYAETFTVGEGLAPPETYPKYVV
ncbi:hypothetical protein [Ruminococcus difficilis]|uniref:Uncharacterized protein n=1 Tax=Ruminococcus difficilis TaxID=2763069 RepID=A0A934TXX6_9FIRM|nr:hypothetical protein [Ruminococcus difficilis]MBK6087451.1 hypothetical protein [Ruminococcus difficilis]